MDSIAVFDCGMSSPLDIGVDILGSRGHARVRMPWYPHLEPQAIELEADGEVTDVATPGSNAYLLELENVCAAVEGRAEPEISREETLRNLQTIERLMGVVPSNEQVGTH